MDGDPFGSKVVTAAELEAMTPQERHEHFVSGIVWDLEELPPTYRAKIRIRLEATIARRDAEQAAQGSQRAS
jgi:hypothetical protein